MINLLRMQWLRMRMIRRRETTHPKILVNVRMIEIEKKKKIIFINYENKYIIIVSIGPLPTHPNSCDLLL